MLLFSWWIFNLNQNCSCREFKNVRWLNLLFSETTCTYTSTRWFFKIARNKNYSHRIKNTFQQQVYAICSVHISLLAMAVNMNAGSPRARLDRGPKSWQPFVKLMAKKRMPPSINCSNATVDLSNLHARTELVLNRSIVFFLDILY